VLNSFVKLIGSVDFRRQNTVYLCFFVIAISILSSGPVRHQYRILGSLSSSFIPHFAATILFNLAPLQRKECLYDYDNNLRSMSDIHAALTLLKAECDSSQFRDAISKLIFTESLVTKFISLIHDVLDRMISCSDVSQLAQIQIEVLNGIQSSLPLRFNRSISNLEFGKLDLTSCDTAALGIRRFARIDDTTVVVNGQVQPYLLAMSRLFVSKVSCIIGISEFVVNTPSLDGQYISVFPFEDEGDHVLSLFREYSDSEPPTNTSVPMPVGMQRRNKTPKGLGNQNLFREKISNMSKQISDNIRDATFKFLTEQFVNRRGTVLA
jgi:hypothetical protein